MKLLLPLLLLGGMGVLYADDGDGRPPVDRVDFVGRGFSLSVTLGPSYEDPGTGLTMRDGVLTGALGPPWTPAGVFFIDQVPFRTREDGIEVKTPLTPLEGYRLVMPHGGWPLLDLDARREDWQDGDDSDDVVGRVNGEEHGPLGKGMSPVRR